MQIRKQKQETFYQMTKNICRRKKQKMNKKVKDINNKINELKKCIEKIKTLKIKK